MPKPRKIEPPSPWDSEVRLLAWLATCVSVFSFLFYFRSGETMLYGDAVAHINIARRVFDSKTPGLLQLGTVWLPLPHLLMIPFLISGKLWQTGAGGSLPSMIAYVFGVVGLFRLTRGVLSRTATPDKAARAAAWIAALIYAANPSLIYMQSTAMGEALYLALFLWAVVYFSEWTRGDGKALTKCGLCLAGLCLTRYDGWFLAVAMTLVVLLTFGKTQSFVGSGGKGARERRDAAKEAAGPSAPRVRLIKFLLIVAAAPAFWLAYNGIVYRNPLEFENGPYSAKAIERRTQSAGNPGHPGTGNPILAGMYFLKAAEDNVAGYEWLQRGWILILLTAAGAAFFAARNRAGQSEPAVSSAWPLAFLLIPVPFYALSIAYGGVPIFIPQWWPFSHYNVRYGLQLLPAFSVAVAILVNWTLRSDEWNRRLRLATVMLLLALVSASYISVWHTGPTCLQEAKINMRTRNELAAQLALLLDKLPPDSTLLMYLGDQVGAVERAGIPLKRTINEGNHRVWKQPRDPDGLWERALASPSQYADYVLALEGDPVWQAVHGSALRELVEIHVTGQARAILYRAR
ncbi:MAG TPA: hypothetical protein VE377_27495 [Candidatus Dormibacteraeota bacterium]|nr:hypothetical protein [Candidatus Dormibacteraeota bacterium]